MLILNVNVNNTVQPSRCISGDSMSALLYIWPLYIHGADPVTSGASGVKIWHLPRTGWKKENAMEVRKLQ
jgi:hypothetical protein